MTDQPQHISVKFCTDNAAFDDNAGPEINQAFSKVMIAISRGDTEGTIKDTNGNTIGQWSWN